MGLLDLIVLLIASTQPLIVGFVAYIGVGRYFARTLSSFFGDAALRPTPYRTYECASYSRLTSMSQISINTLTLLFAFLIYDVDLMLLVSEVVVVTSYGPIEILLCFVFILSMGVGLCFDYNQHGSSWSLT